MRSTTSSCNPLLATVKATCNKHLSLAEKYKHQMPMAGRRRSAWLSSGQSPPEALSHRTLPFPSRTRTHHHLLLLLPTQPPGVSSSSPSLPCPRHSSSSTLLSRCLLRLLRGGVRAGLAEERARVGFCSWKASASSAGRHLGPCLPPFSAFFFAKLSSSARPRSAPAAPAIRSRSGRSD